MHVILRLLVYKHLYVRKNFVSAKQRHMENQKTVKSIKAAVVKSKKEDPLCGKKTLG